MFPILHVEVLQSRQSNASENNIVQWLQPFFDKVKKVTAAQKFNEDDFKKHQAEYLISHIEAVNICDVSQTVEQQNLSDVSIKYHIYRLDETGPHNEMIEDGDGDKANEISAASQWILPSVDFHGLWESLIYDSRIKENLLQFIESTLVFSDRFVDSNIISWNRVVLLHGPPGTGKTSLCKALAQKLSIRLSDRYTHGQLVEINSHSLFSKWFSESGKLVMKMFAQIREMIEDRRALVCVLIDEVESLAHTRQSSLAGSEPSDSIRVVNAVLTQLDQIRRYPNVLILTTSNITGAIDLAFVDRADIKQYIPLPTAKVIYEIYRSCIQELFRTGIICPEEKLFPNVTRVCQVEQNHVLEASYRLFTVALASQGISGRSLRKIPFLAHALFVSSETTTLGNFLVAMSNAVAKHIGDSELLTNGIKAIKIEDTKTVPISDMNGH